MQRVYEWHGLFGSDAFDIVRHHFEADKNNQLYPRVEDRIQFIEKLLGDGLPFRYRSMATVDGITVRLTVIHALRY